MDENSNMDEIASAAEREPGDAKKAWRLLAASIEGTDLPTWVKAYVQRSARVVAEFDVQADDQALLAHNLGFFREVKTVPGGYDQDHIFDWFTVRMMEDVAEGKKINVSRTAREYKEANRMFNSAPDGIRKAYEKARTRFSQRMEAGAELERLLAERGI